MDIHVTPLGHIILIQSQPVFALYTNYIVFDLTRCHEIAEQLALNNNHSLNKFLFHLFLVRSNIKERIKMQLSIFNVYDD
jgi:hypothetical protein